MSQPPNIVVVMADQLAPHFTGAYGHPVVKTPNLDALAAEGMRFDAAYCNSPLCAPSRASFMTGQLPSRLGTYDNAAEFPASIPTFAHYLRAAGYRTCLSGKMHFVGPDQLHGFEERLTTDVYPADLTWTPNWDAPDTRIAHWYHNMDAVTEAGTAATTFQYEYDEEATFLARRKIFDYRMTGDAPFALVVSLIHPHDPYVGRKDVMALYDEAEIDLPETGAADDPWSHRQAVAIEADRVIPTEDQIRRARHAYYANVSFVDAKLGEIVQALKDADLYENTVILFTSDHGDMLGERCLWYKMNWFEHSARVPLVLRGPGVAQGQNRDPVSLVDLLPTFLDIAGISPELGMPLDGQSIWPLAQGGAAPDRMVRGEYLAEIASHPLLMLRRGPLKYIQCDRDPPQLYDVEADPGEQRNLATEPAFAAEGELFAREVRDIWDTRALRDAVLASQRRRRAVNRGLQEGQWTSWDYAPPANAAQAYVRTQVSWDDVVHRMMYPAPQNQG